MSNFIDMALKKGSDVTLRRDEKQVVIPPANNEGYRYIRFTLFEYQMEWCILTGISHILLLCFQQKIVPIAVLNCVFQKW